MLKQYGSVLSRIEETYGVPGEVLVAIWGLETDFGANIGKFPTLRSLATLAYDCRRAETFRGELLDALRIIDRGDLNPSEMRGAWAGEIGQTQFMPSSYIKYAVDFDANGEVVGFDIDHASRKLDLSKVETVALPAISAAE